MFCVRFNLSPLHLSLVISTHCRAFKSLHVDSDKMSHLERPGRQGQRRKHHRWSGPNHFHNDGSRSVCRQNPARKKKSRLPGHACDCDCVCVSRAHVFQHYDGFKSPRTSTLDELTLEHMSQDCSTLRNQLIRLKTLLQVGAALCMSGKLLAP